VLPPRDESEDDDSLEAAGAGEGELSKVEITTGDAADS
jgi:hypothetical protein